MKTNVTKPWFQYSLRSMFCFTLFCAVVSAWFGLRLSSSTRQREAVALIKKAGGSVEYDFEIDENGEMLFGRSAGPEWMCDWLGVDILSNAVSVVWFNSDSQFKLELLPLLPSVTIVHLVGGEINDAGIESLCKLSKLRKLFLINTSVTQDGLAKIGRVLPNCTIDAQQSQRDAR